MESNNPLLAKQKSILPGQTFRIPSKGVFYENQGILADEVVDGEVAVYPMRLKEELSMKSIDGIFQGTAITDTIRYCVPQILKPEKLASEDIDYLLTAIKKISHGNYITYRDKCFDPNKELEEGESSKEKDILGENATAEFESQESVFDLAKEDRVLNEDELAKVNNPDDITTKEIRSDECEFNIPISYFLENCKEIDVNSYEQDYIRDFKQFTIHIKPLSFIGFKDLSTLRVQENRKLTDQEYIEYVTEFSNRNIVNRLAKVDDVTDYNMIYEWVDSLNTNERAELFKIIAEASSWGINFDYEITCQKCGMKKKTNQSHINPIYFFL